MKTIYIRTSECDHCGYSNAQLSTERRPDRCAMCGASIVRVTLDEQRVHPYRRAATRGGERNDRYRGRA